MSIQRLSGAVAGIAAAMAGALLGGGGGVAEATFAGANGLLAYSTDGNCDLDDPDFRGCPGIYIEVANPRRPKQRRAVTCKPDPCRAEFPVWSPDGKRLLYSTPGGVFVSRGDRFRRRLVVRRAAEPAWSADGRRLVFARTLDGFGGRYEQELFVRSLRGGHARRITRGGGYLPDWSSRGEIAFVRTAFAGRRARSDVYVVRPDGTELRRLTRGDTGNHPSWSPDGRLLAIVRRVRGRRRIEIIDRSGRLKRTLTRAGATDPVWSPDGTRIAFTRDRQLYSVRARGGGLRRMLPGLTSFQDLDWQPRPRR